MKLKGYFWILAVSGTGAAAALGVLALPEKPLLFWSAEAGALIILLLFIGLYRNSYGLINCFSAESTCSGSRILRAACARSATAKRTI